MDSNARVRIALAIALVLTLSAGASAQSAATSTQGPSEEALGEEVNDPTASLTRVQFKNNFTPARYGTNAQTNTVQVRPILAVLPHGPMELEQIVRPTFSLVTIARGRGAATRTEFGDTQLLDLMVMPWPNTSRTGFRWGIGPYLVLPTATSHSAGSSVWQLGPAFAFRLRPVPRLQISALVQQATSFAYTTPDASPVTVLTFQPMLSYQLGRGWYLRSSDATWTFNMRHGTSTRVPISFGGGKVWTFTHDAAINSSLSGEWMAYRQFAPQSAQFTVKFQITLVLPKVRM
jgi:hypothetical protein